MQQGALAPGERVLLVDDVLATGGTLLAAAGLLSYLRVELVGVSVLVELAALGGRARWRDPAPVVATLVY